jgi:hypothetical protein
MMGFSAITFTEGFSIGNQDKEQTNYLFHYSKQYFLRVYLHFLQTKD